MKKPGKGIKWIYLGLLALIWGSSFILMKRGLTVYTPAQLAGIRMTVACIASFALVAHRVNTVPRKSLKYVAAVGFLGSGIPAILFAAAQTRINSSLAGMLNSLTPVFTMLLGLFFFRSKFTSLQVIGVLTGFAGAAGLILIRSEGGLSADAGYAFLIVIATICYGLSVNTIKTYLSGIDSLLISGTSLLFVGIPYLIYLFCTDFTMRLTGDENGVSAFIYIVLLGLMGTAVSNYLYFQLVKVSSPLFASAVAYLIPIIALMWGVLDGEPLNPVHLLAMLAILGGVALISRQNRVAPTAK